MKKNVLFLIDGLLGGGAERVVLTLAAGMLQQDHDVTLVSLRSACVYPLPKGLHYHVLEDHYRGPFRSQTKIRRQARALDRLLASLFEKKELDLAVSHLFLTDRIVAASKYLQNANSWYCLHCALTAGTLEGKSFLRRWWKRRRLLKTYSHKRLITVSQGLQEDVLAVGIRPACLKTIYNPFDLEQIRTKAQEKSAFEGEKFLLHVGRFHPQKRHDRLFEAFKMSGYPGKLVLLGDGTAEEKESLQHEVEKQNIADRVVFGGFTANPYAVMRAAEALVVSSDFEGLSSVLIEALACGTQVVSTNCPYGSVEILQGPLAQGLSELTAPSLAAAIQRVLASPVTITDEMLAPFTIEESVRQYLASS